MCRNNTLWRLSGASDTIKGTPLYRRKLRQYRGLPPCLWSSHQQSGNYCRCDNEDWLVAIATQRFSILNTFVPQTGQTPWVAGLRFLSITRRGFLISLFLLHFMQYAVAIIPSFCFSLCYIVTTGVELCQYLLGVGRKDYRISARQTRVEPYMVRRSKAISGILAELSRQYLQRRSQSFQAPFLSQYRHSLK